MTLIFFPGDAGFIIAYNQEELLHIIGTYSEDDYRKNCEDIIKYFNITESGNSAAEICKIINDKYLEMHGNS